MLDGSHLAVILHRITEIGSGGMSSMSSSPRFARRLIQYWQHLAVVPWRDTKS